MLQRMAVVLALAVGASGGTVTVNGLKLEVGRKLTTVEHVEFQGISLYEAKVQGTDEAAMLVTGYLVSHLPSPAYVFQVTIDLWQIALSSTPNATAETRVAYPQPGKPTKFAAFTVCSAAGFKAYSIRYSFERVSAADHAKQRLAPEPR